MVLLRFNERSSQLNWFQEIILHYGLSRPYNNKMIKRNDVPTGYLSHKRVFFNAH